MYWIGRPRIPPLSFTQSKYAWAVFWIVVKSTPGMSMLIVPILIGFPVAFFPVPMPQTAFVADGLPDPTGGAVFVWPPPVARAVVTSATTRQAAREIPPTNFLDLILPPRSEEHTSELQSLR